MGLASPYLNEQIKKYTEGDTQANLIAHALLGAVEAAATGNNILAGAAAGAGSEAAADFIVRTLYDGKSTQDLTEAEKQNVTFLSQLAGGLASGIIGDSTQSAAVGSDIGKRAVENNFFNLIVENPSEDWQLIAKGQAQKQDVIDAVYNDPEIVKAIEAGKTVGEILIDFTPVLGDAKAFYEAEGAIDYALAMAGVFPIAGDAIVALKGAKSAYKAARKAELSGDIAEAQRNLQEGKNLINQYYTQINDLGDVSTNNKVKTQLKTELAFKEANILNIDGTLTRKAITDSSMIPLSDGVIKNPEIVKVLTRDGSKIEDWNKYTTQSIKLPNGQSMQIHYYKNEKTGKVDYDTKDFKVKGVVKSW